MPTKIASDVPDPDELAINVEILEPRLRFAVVLGAVGGFHVGEWKAMQKGTSAAARCYVAQVSEQAQWVQVEG